MLVLYMSVLHMYVYIAYNLYVPYTSVRILQTQFRSSEGICEHSFKLLKWHLRYFILSHGRHDGAAGILRFFPKHMDIL